VPSVVKSETNIKPIPINIPKSDVAPSTLIPQAYSPNISNITINTIPFVKPTIVTDHKDPFITTSNFPVFIRPILKNPTITNESTILNTFKIMTYNVLADCYSPPDWYPDVAPNVIKWEYRKPRII